MAHHELSGTRTVVLELNGLQWASEKNTAEAVLLDRPGVESAAVNPVAQTATVTFDPAGTTVDDLARWITECGYHCRGESVPDHLCRPPSAVLGAPVHIASTAAAATPLRSRAIPLTAPPASWVQPIRWAIGQR